MGSNSSGPLSEKDYTDINKHLRSLENTQMEIGRALQAGFDCAPEDQQCKQLIDAFQKVKKVYFPNRP